MSSRFLLPLLLAGPGWVAVLEAEPALVPTWEAITPAPEIRQGGINAALLTPSGAWAVYRAPGTDLYRRELYAVPTGPETVPPIRLNRPLPGSSTLLDFDLLGDGETVVFHTADEIPGQNELFAYDLRTGERRRLNAPLPVVESIELDFDRNPPSTGGVFTRFDHIVMPPESEADESLPPFRAPGDVWAFEVSPGRQWVLYLAPASPAGPLTAFIVPADGSRPPQELPHHPLRHPDFATLAFLADETQLVVGEEGETSVRLGVLDLDTMETAWIDTIPIEEVRVSASEVILDEPSRGLLVKYAGSNSNLTTRYRWADLDGEQPARWITSSEGREYGSVHLPESRLLILMFQALNPNPPGYQIIAVDLDSGSERRLASGTLSQNREVEYLYVDRRREMATWTAAGIRWGVPLAGGEPFSFSALANVEPSDRLGDRGQVEMDATGALHWFYNHDGGIWHLDLDPTAVPQRVADGKFERVLALDEANRTAILHGARREELPAAHPILQVSLDRQEVRELALVSKANNNWLLYGHSIAQVRGPVLYHRNVEGRLARVDFATEPTTRRYLSPPLMATGEARLLSLSPTREWWALSLLLTTEQRGLHVMRADGSGLHLIQNAAVYPDQMHWTPSGRFLVYTGKDAPYWRAVDLEQEFAEIEIPVDFYNRLVALTPSHEAVIARADENLTFSLTPLTGGEPHDVFTLPTPGSGTMYAGQAMVSPDGRWLVLSVDQWRQPRRIWRIPLTGGEALLLADATTHPEANVIVAVDNDDAFIRGYDSAVFRFPLDGGDPVRLTEARPAGSTVTGASNLSIDLERRQLAYETHLPDGHKRMVRRSLDEPDELGYAGEVFAQEGERLQLRAGVLAFHTAHQIWTVAAERGSPPVPMAVRDPSRWVDWIELGPDGRAVYALIMGGGVDLVRFDRLTGEATPMAPTFTNLNNIHGFAVGRDDDEVLFVSDLEQRYRERIYRSRIGPPAPPPDWREHADYAAWAAAENLPADWAAPEADADGNGVSNLLEYVHRSHPMDFADRPAFSVSVSSLATGWVELTYRAGVDPRPVHLRPQVSRDLRFWFDLPQAPDPTSELLGDGTREITWEIEPVANVETFYRLRVSLP